MQKYIFKKKKFQKITGELNQFQCWKPIPIRISWNEYSQAPKQFWKNVQIMYVFTLNILVLSKKDG